MENALIGQKQAIAKDLAGSVVIGAGQFCTCPGLVLIIDSDASIKFRSAFAEQIADTTPAPMLNKNIYKACIEGVKAFQNAPEIFNVYNTTDRVAMKLLQ